MYTQSSEADGDGSPAARRPRSKGGRRAQLKRLLDGQTPAPGLKWPRLDNADRPPDIPPYEPPAPDVASGRGAFRLQGRGRGGGQSRTGPLLALQDREARTRGHVRSVSVAGLTEDRTPRTQPNGPAPVAATRSVAEGHWHNRPFRKRDGEKAGLELIQAPRAQPGGTSSSSRTVGADFVIPNATRSVAERHWHNRPPRKRDGEEAGLEVNQAPRAQPSAQPGSSRNAAADADTSFVANAPRNWSPIPEVWAQVP